MLEHFHIVNSHFLWQDLSTGIKIFVLVILAFVGVGHYWGHCVSQTHLVFFNVKCIMNYYTPHEMSSGGRFSAAHDIGKPYIYIWHMGLSPWDNVSRTFTTLVWPLSLTSRSNFQGFFLSSCPTRNFTLLWHWHIKFGTRVYHHETMCLIHSWSQYDINLWVKCQIYWVFDSISCLGHSFFVLWHL